MNYEQESIESVAETTDQELLCLRLRICECMRLRAWQVENGLKASNEQKQTTTILVEIKIKSARFSTDNRHNNVVSTIYELCAIDV